MNENTSKRIFQSGSLLAVIVAIIFIIFLVLQFVGGLLSSVDTTPAIRITANDSFVADGWFFRDEIVAQGTSSETVKHIVHSGEKVQKNAALAVVYNDTKALDTSQQVSILDDEIALLTAAVESATGSTDTSKLDQQIATGIANISAQTDDGVVAGIQKSATSLRNMCLRRSASELDGTVLSAQLSTLNTQRDTLQQQLSGRSTTIASPASGFFADIVDGMEGQLTTDRLDSLSVQDLKDLDKSYQDGTSQDNRQFGKIVQDFRWYFAMLVPNAELKKMQAGNTLYLRFPQVEDDIPVTVYRIQKDTDSDEALLVVSGMNVTPELVTMRKQEAEVIRKSYTGIKVPKSAVKIRTVQTDEGDKQQQGVYILTGSMSRFKPIDVVFEADDYYVVKQGITSEDTGIVAGDNIIVKAHGLDDLKVIK